MCKKILYSLLLFTACTVHISAQETLKKYKIDKYFSIGLPGKITRKDTVFSNVPVERHFAESGTGTFVVQKLKISGDEKVLGELPHDEKSLNKTYREFASSLFEECNLSGIHTHSGAKMTIDNHKAYTLQLMYGKKHIGEYRFIILGDYLYMILYMDYQEGYTPDFATPVFRSVDISPDSPPQFIKKQSYIRVFGRIIAFLLIAGIGFLIKRIRNRNNESETPDE